MREKSERDEGYIDGTRHMPYRLVRAFADDLRAEQKPVVTICTTGSRATIAASVLDGGRRRGASRARRRRRGLGRARRSDGALPPLWQLSSARSSRRDTALAFPAMQALRPHYVEEAAFVERVDEVQRAEGYRLVGDLRGRAGTRARRRGLPGRAHAHVGALPLRRRSLDAARSAPPRLRQTATRLAGRGGRAARLRAVPPRLGRRPDPHRRAPALLQHGPRDHVVPLRARRSSQLASARSASPSRT